MCKLTREHAKYRASAHPSVEDLITVTLTPPRLSPESKLARHGQPHSSPLDPYSPISPMSLDGQPHYSLPVGATHVTTVANTDSPGTRTRIHRPDPTRQIATNASDEQLILRPEKFVI